MTQAPPLYALRLAAPGHYTMAKFIMPDFTVEAVYNLTNNGNRCDCPAGSRTVILKPCKHRKMLPFMLGACNTDRFYEPESRSWCQPLAPDLVGEAEPREVNGKADELVVIPGISPSAEAVEAHRALAIEYTDRAVLEGNPDGTFPAQVVTATVEAPKLRRRV